MRILHVFPFFSIGRGGGTAHLLHKLAKAQASRGHAVTIYTGDYQYDKEYAASLSAVTVKPFKSLLNGGLFVMPGLVPTARKEIKEFDIIHLHCLRSFQNIVVCHYAAKYGVPYVLNAHGSVQKYERRILIKTLFDHMFGYRILRRVSRFIADTEIGTAEYEDIGVDRNRITVVPLPFSLEECSALPSRGRFREKFRLGPQPFILILGRIHWIKGIDFLVEGLNELTKVRDNVTLIVAGPDDGFRDDLVAMIQRYRLSNRVILTGFLSAEEKLEALVDADVLVQPSRHEHAAYGCMDAVLCGTPIIVSKNTGAGEEVERLNAGQLVEFGNVPELVRTIQAILDNPDDARARTRRAADYIRTHFSTPRRMEQLEAVYADCLNGVRG